jgi:hypothetical protein
VRFVNHRTEFINGKEPALLTGTLLTKQDRAAEFESDKNRDNQQLRQKQNQR